MSRVNKYRGMHIHALPQNKHLDGKWVYGYLADENYINSPELGGEFLIDKDTVGRYTGKTDKDGKEIYEGDIVRQFADCTESGTSLYYFYKIEWNDEYCAFVGREIYSDEVYLFPDLGNIEVVGNVHENKNFLRWI